MPARLFTVGVNHLFTVTVLCVAIFFGCVVYMLNSDHSNFVYTPETPARGVALMFSNSELISEPIELGVTGEFPHWLDGDLFRNGPGKFDFPANTKGGTYHINHWFDGLTYLHKFTVRDGRVWYRNAETASALEEYIAVHGNAPISFGPDPCKSIFYKFSSLFDGLLGEKKPTPRNVGVTIKKIRGEYYSCTDAAVLQKFDPETLHANETITTSDLHPYFAEHGVDFTDGLSTAHGQYDSGLREWSNVITRLGKNARYNFVTIPDEEGKAPKISEDIDGPPVYLHSYAMTKNYFILQLHNARINMFKLLWNKEVLGALYFEDKKPALFYVVERTTGKHVASFEADPFFTFHNVNARESEEGDIVMDLLQYKDMAVLQDLHLKRFRSAEGIPNVSSSMLTRYLLPAVAAQNKSLPVKVEPSRVVKPSRGLELPRFDPRLHMKDYRFVYGIQTVDGPSVWEGLSKVDIKVTLAQTSNTKTWNAADVYAAEPIFVPTPGGEAEDDGVLLSICTDVAEGSSFLLALNASTMEEIARADTPHSIPMGFHGNFYGSQSTDVA